MKKCKDILSLRPTQLAYGMLEVQAKVQELRKMRGGKLKKFLKDNAVNVVIGPDGTTFIVDGHHRVSACWIAEIKKIYIEIKHDYSKSHLSYKEFWKEMHKNRWCHLYDQFGDGPRCPLYLPQDIRGMADDPYRALAWLVKESGGFEDSSDPFANFKWAGYFRKHKLLDNQFEIKMEAAVKKALKFCHSRGAKRLPGYNPKRVK